MSRVTVTRKEPVVNPEPVVRVRIDGVIAGSFIEAVLNLGGGVSLSAFNSGEVKHAIVMSRQDAIEFFQYALDLAENGAEA